MLGESRASQRQSDRKPIFSILSTVKSAHRSASERTTVAALRAQGTMTRSVREEEGRRSPVRLPHAWRRPVSSSDAGQAAAGRPSIHGRAQERLEAGARKDVVPRRSWFETSNRGGTRAGGERAALRPGAGVADGDAVGEEGRRHSCSKVGPGRSTTQPAPNRSVLRHVHRSKKNPEDVASWVDLALGYCLQGR